MTPAAATTFDDLPVPLSLGSTFFSPAIEQVRKFAYAVEDESGWLVGAAANAPGDALVHPQFLSTYMWWPSGFYLRAPGEIGHFGLFRQRHGHLVGTPYLHAKSSVRFLRPFRLGRPIRADVAVTEKYRRRGRDFIVMRASFFDADGEALAVYDHTCAIRSESIPRAAAPSSAPSPAATAAPAETLPPRRIEMSLEKSRLFSLPAENYHTHDHLAQALGVRVAIPAAMMSFAYLSRFAEDVFGAAWISRGQLDAVFTRMLQRDDVLSVEGHRQQDAALALSICNARREPVAIATARLLDLP